MISHRFEDALESYHRAYSPSPFMKTWVPREKFVEVDFDDFGNISISREDEGIYGIAIGEKPSIPKSWERFSIDSRAIKYLPLGITALGEWDAYWAPTLSGAQDVERKFSDSEIDTFLKTHAPDSSVFPGNSEILDWVEIVKEDELAGVAALCRWQSGFGVISSVATHTNLRGQGVGKELMYRCLGAARILDFAEVSLGVRHQNESAVRLYNSTGFTLMHNFTYCERR